MPADTSVIDLTADSSPPGPSSVRDAPANAEVDDAAAKAGKLRRKKKKRATGPVTSEASTPTLVPAREEGEVVEDNRRKRRKEERRAKRSPSLPPTLDLDADTLFFVDVGRGAPAMPNGPEAARAESVLDQTAASLLLPAHVSVLPSANGTAVPVQIIEEESGSEEDEFIEFIDYNDRQVAGIVRYFEKQEEDTSKATKVVCKHCGAKGEHKTFECPILICLTCGARDEHSTRSCPISKTCFNCGLKGHVAQSCPTRHVRGSGRARLDECDRCGSSTHSTMECPTIWRIYDYATPEERDAMLAAHTSGKDLAMGEGGETYIATDDWCHYCGECGHLGDDCLSRDRAPSAPSAFGLYSLMTGPFYDPDAQAPSGERRAPRDWESADYAPGGWGANAPSNVGQQGRRKEKARMEERARQAHDEGEDDDWFGSRLGPPARSNTRAGPAKKPAFSFNGGARDRDRDRDRQASNGRHHESERRDPERSRPRHDDGGLSIKGASKRPLSERLGDADRGDHGDSRRRWDDRRESDNRHRSGRGSESRDRDRDDGHRNREGYRHRHSRPPASRDREDNFRPRYNGGYVR